MIKFLPFLEKQLFSDGLSPRSVIDNILAGTTYYRKTSLAYPLADLSYYLTILESGASGFSYFHGDPIGHQTLLSLIDRSPYEILKKERIPLSLRVSLLDSMYENYNRAILKKPTRTYMRNGNYHEKAKFRAKLLTKNIKPKSKVLMIGLVTEFLDELLNKDITVRITDKSPQLKGASVRGIQIIDGERKKTLKALASADYALVTGAVFTTNTIDEILHTAKIHDTKLCFYLETGSNFAPYLLENGAFLVLAEKFPFYDLPGQSTFEIYE